jgi:hypothetical protein
MSEYIENMFAIPIFHLYVDDWENKKQKLIEIANRQEYERKEGEYVDNDYYNPTKSYWEEIQPLLAIEIQRFVDQMDKNFTINRYWFERASRGQQHLPHNHGATGFSAVCYVDYDETEHTPTRFLSPFNEFDRGLQITYEPHDIKSGSMIFFPSSIHHFTTPCESDKERLILSFNLTPHTFNFPLVQEPSFEEPKLKINYI